MAAPHSDPGSNPAPEGAPQVLERLIRQAETAGASDIHLQRQSDSATIAFRLDGVMVPAGSLPGDLAEHVFGRIKFLARLKTYQESLPQDGRIERAAVGTNTDIRVATYPTVSGEKIVLRMFTAGEVTTLDRLDLPPDALEALRGFLRQTSGLLLLTGPAGSGKTTTIYACLRELAAMGGRHVITIEDPAEQLVPGIMQTEVNEAMGLDFPRAARHLLRQDPQVLVIGEIRDEQTAAIAVRAALTGHLLISTLHAGSCQGVLERLATLCPDLSSIASSLAMVFNQRLVRRACSQCHAKGCPACLGTGYKGRLPVVEFVEITPAVRSELAAGRHTALAAGTTLIQRANALASAGLTTSAEVQRVLGTSPQ